MPDDTFTFLHANDSHLGSPRSYRFAPDYNYRWQRIKNQMREIDAAFLLHGGDFTRDGDTHEQEYELARNDLLDLPFPVHAIAGNMDVGNKHTHHDAAAHGSARLRDIDINMTSARLRLFAGYFGPLHWSFLHGNTRFTGFYAAVTGSGLPEERMFWQLLDAVKAQPRMAHHVVVMHYWLFMNDIDDPQWDITDREQYLNWYFSIDREPRMRIFEWMQQTGVDVVFSGHVHLGLPVKTIEGIDFHRTASAGNRAQLTQQYQDSDPRQGFHRCDVRGDELKVSFIPCDDLETAKQLEAQTYGKGGHPPREGRDYSVAREQPPLTLDPGPEGLPG